MNDESLFSLVLRDEKVNLILNHLRSSVHDDRPFHIRSSDISYIKKKFQEGIQVGEKKLHEFSFELINKLANMQDAVTTLIVWGRCSNPEHRDINKSYTNIKWGEVFSAKYIDSIITWAHSPTCKVCHQKTNTIASFYQYKFDKDFPSGLKTMLSRIKTTSNICYKITDMVFDIDRMFQRDKIVNKYAQVLTDVYGIKMAFQGVHHIHQTIDFLRSQENLKILDEKNYIGENRKKSGFEAYKITLERETQIFEIQLQTLQMLETERSNLTVNHRTYKEKQMEERKKLGDRYQNLYDVLIQLFASNYPVDYRE